SLRPVHLRCRPAGSPLRGCGSRSGPGEGLAGCPWRWDRATEAPASVPGRRRRFGRPSRCRSRPTLLHTMYNVRRTELSRHCRHPRPPGGSVKITSSAVSLNVNDVAASSTFLTTHLGFHEEMAADGFASLTRDDAGMNVVFLRRGLESLPEDQR